VGQSFFGLNIAIRGLYTSQKGLDSVNHNLANANTPGYSRQQIAIVAARPTLMNDGTGMMGTGSDVTGIERVRDEYLDSKYWNENIAYGEWDIKKTLLSGVEITFNEPSDTGFSTVTQDFYSALQELSKDPNSQADRVLVREKAVTFTKYFKNIASHLESQQSDANSNIKAKVDEVNSFAMQIQQLNKQIYTSELDGSTANDLRDQRTLLTDKLSKIVDIKTNEVTMGKLANGKDDKHLLITIGGKALVDHFGVSKLSTTSRDKKLNEEDIANIYQVGWADGNKLILRGGELKGYIEVRDGNGGGNSSPDYNGIPYYLNKINEFVRTFAKAFNEGYTDTKGNAVEGHADGYDTKGDTGIRFFTMTGADGNPLTNDKFLKGATDPAAIAQSYSKITAKNFSISAEILKDPGTISVSDAVGQTGNVNNLKALIGQRYDSHMFSAGAPEDYIKSIIATLGIDSQQASNLSSSQETMVKQVDIQRMSVSGVSIDEEMTNLIKFQHSYEASAKVIQTMSDIYDTLINRLGV